jgi:alkylated DNA repair dioxygenase AlkB
LLITDKHHVVATEQQAQDPGSVVPSSTGALGPPHPKPTVARLTKVTSRDMTADPVTANVETTEIETQTDSCQTLSFSPLTCYELIGKLSEVQLLREITLVDNKASTVQTRSTSTSTNTKTKNQTMLLKHYKSLFIRDSDLQTNSLQQLISVFAYHAKTADDQLVELQSAISDAEQTIRQLSSRATHHSASDTSPQLDLLSCSSGNSDDESGTECELPFIKHAGSPLKIFNIESLDSATVFNRKFKNRQVGYYGDIPYRYGGAYHPPRPIDDNLYLVDIAAAVKGLYPDLRFNSALVTKYDGHRACLPPHSDNEPSIVPDSTILTVSLGQPRDIHFRRKLSTDRAVLTVEHGDVYTMTRSSQDLYDHAVPATDQSNDGTRISITFRLLAPPDNDTRPAVGRPTPDTSNRHPTTNRTKRVLILSDSKNTTFDCSVVRDPVVCFREDMFYLRDLLSDRHSTLIKKADVVLISAGINDLRKNKVSPRLLHDHMQYFVQQAERLYPNTRFLFDAITPLSVSADRFHVMNNIINELNQLLVGLSVRSKNFKLFDNLNFGVPHLARDGIHLNDAGKRVVSVNWVHCILLALQLRVGFLPLRRNFSSIIDGYRAKI